MSHPGARTRAVGSDEERPAVIDLLRSTAQAVSTAGEILEGLTVDADRMGAALRASGGLVMAERVAGELAPVIGHGQARELVAAACQEVLAGGGKTMPEAVVGRLPEGTGVSEAVVESWLDPVSYLGSVAWFIDRGLARHAAMKRERAGDVSAGRSGGPTTGAGGRLRHDPSSS